MKINRKTINMYMRTVNIVDTYVDILPRHVSGIFAYRMQLNTPERANAFETEIMKMSREAEMNILLTGPIKVTTLQPMTYVVDDTFFDE